MADTRIKVGLSDDVLADVDRLRGDVPRERWLRRAVEEKVARAKPDWEDALGPQEPLRMRRPNTLPAGAEHALQVLDDAEEDAEIDAARNTGYAGGTKGASTTPAKQPVRKNPPTAREPLDHPFLGGGPRCLRVDCPDPKARVRHLPDPPY